MRILRIQVSHVRSLQGPIELRLGPGLNVVHGPNETGKSTLFDAVWAGLHFPSSSKHADVRALLPWSGQAPEVTLEFETGGQVYELYKKWEGGGTTRLFRPGAPEAKPLKGAEAESALEALLGAKDKNRGAWPLLRVAQGDSIARVAEMLPASSRENLAKGLSGMAVAGTGMEAVLGNVAQEYAAYFTDTGRERRGAGAPLAIARTKLEETNRKLAELEGLRAQHDQELRDWERLVDELAVLRPKRPVLERALADAKAAEEQVRRLFGQRDVVAGELRNAELVERTALERLNRRRVARAKISEQERRLVEQRAQADRAQRDADLRRGQLPALEAGLVSANDDQAKAEARLEQLRARDELLRLEAELARHDRALGEARGTLARIAELEPEQATLKISPELFGKLQGLDMQRREAAAALRAASTTVCLRVLRDVPVALGDEALSLAGGDRIERELSSPVVLRIGDLADLEIRPGGAELEKHRTASRELEDRLSRNLAAFGVADLEAARGVAERRRTVDEELARLRTDVKKRFPRGLAPLEQERLGVLRRLELVRARPCAADLDAEAVARELAGAEVAAVSSKTAVTSARTAVEAARRALTSAETTEQKARAEVQGLETALAAAREDVLRAVEGEGVDLALEQAFTEATERKKERAGALAGIDSQLDALGREQAYERRAKAKVALEELDQNLKRKDELRIQSEARLSTAEVSGLHERIAGAVGAVADATAAADAQEAQARAVKLLSQTLAVCEAEAKGQLIEPMQAAVVPLLEKILGPSSLGLDRNLEVTELIRNEGAATPEVLSHGAREQVSIAVRLAMAKVLAGDDRLPVFLDDAFVWSDSVRFRNVVEVLASLTGHLQVIVATCHPERWTAVPLESVEIFDLDALKHAGGELQAAS